MPFADLLVYTQSYFYSALEFKLKSGVLLDQNRNYFYIQQECELIPSVLINCYGEIKTLDWFIALLIFPLFFPLGSG